MLVKKVFALKRAIKMGLVILPLGSAYAAASFDTLEYRRQEGLAMINASQAYALGYTGQGVVVGVMDSGIFARHPEFYGKIAGGYDFTLSQPVSMGNGVDHDGHGSHVNGIVGARRDGVGMHGVAFDAGLFSVALDGESDEGLDGAMAEGWNFLSTQRIPIINNSLGFNDCDRGASGTSSDPCNIREYGDGANVQAQHSLTVEAAHRVASSGALMVFATGNEGQPHPDVLAGMPLYFDSLQSSWLAVTAVDMDRDIADYANRCGDAMQWCMAAPGGGDDQDAEGIYSVKHTGGYVRFSGTSMAAPHVAGAAALVKQAFPYFSAYHLQQTLLTTATDLGDAGVDDVFGWGLLNVGKAVSGPGQFTDVFDVDTLGYDSTFSNNISGVGGLTKRGAGVLRLSGINGYTGQTTVAGGKLVVNGALQTSTVVVERPGTLGGSGSVAHLDNYGVVAPGNSIGTLTVTGDFASRAGSVYQIEVDSSGDHDRINVGGRAVIDAGSQLELQGGPYRQGVRYDFLNAGLGITGTFDTVIADFAFLAPRLDVTDVMSLSVSRNDVPFARYTLSSNQRAVAGVLDTVSTTPPPAMGSVYDAVLNAAAAEVPALMQDLSGELHASTQSVLLNDSKLAPGIVLRHAGAKLGAAPTASSSTGRPLWAEVVGSWSTQRGGDNAAGTRSHVAGLFIGGDATLDNGWRLGAAAGFTDGKVRLDGQPASAELRSYTAALYGGKQWHSAQGNLNFLAGMAYTHQDVDSRRYVGGGIAQSLTTSYRANASQVFSEVGYGMAVGQNSVVEPYIGARLLSQRSGAFNEGDMSAALGAKAQTDNIAMLTLGVRASTSIELANKDVDVSAALGWRRAAGDIDVTRKMYFTGGNGTAFTVAGQSIARDTALVDLSAELALDKMAAIGLAYSGEFARRHKENTGSVFLKIRF